MFGSSVQLSPLYKEYIKFTQKYHSGKLSARRFWEWAIRTLAIILQKTKGFHFPSRAIGGWWSIWRYRFEMLVGWYEYPTLLWMKKIVKPGMTVVDIGAHIGYFTQKLSRLVGSDGAVLAFEPSPENFPVLQANLTKRQYMNVIPVQAAVSNKPGRASFFVSPGHSNHSLVNGYTKHEKIEEVNTVSLDQYLEGSGRKNVDLIKIDTEGAELFVLEGLASELSRNENLALIVEINPKALGAAGSSPEKLLAAISSYGFIARVISPDGTLWDISGQSFEDTPNLLCMKSRRWGELVQQTK